MDPFEEFEFKPLTDGLGFHKKKTAPVIKEEIQTSEVSATAFTEESNELLPPLPRKARNSVPTLPTAPVGTEGSAAVDEILKTLKNNRRLDFENSKNQKAAPAKEEFKKTVWSFSAGLLDMMLVVAAGLLCMIILLVITKVDLVRNLSNPDSQGLIYVATFAMFAGVAFIYLVLNRIYMGCTPGEWAFDQRVGKPEELNSAIYSLKVVARSILVIATGFVVFPILSVLIGRDFLGSITGAQLYRKV